MGRSIRAGGCGDHVEEDGEGLFRLVCKSDLAGAVAKQKYAPYLPDRETTWFKIRNRKYKGLAAGNCSNGGVEAIRMHSERLPPLFVTPFEKISPGLVVLEGASTYGDPLLLGVELQQGTRRMDEKRFEFTFVFLLFDHVKREVLDLQLMLGLTGTEPREYPAATDIPGVSHRVVRNVDSLPADPLTSQAFVYVAKRLERKLLAKSAEQPLAAPGPAAASV